MTGGFSGWAFGAGGSAMANQATQDLGAVQCGEDFFPFVCCSLGRDESLNRVFPFAI
jgi:hypothetical protein